MRRVEVIGNATLYLGDCREILPLLPKVDAVVTDPPYGVALKKKTNDFRDSEWYDDGENAKATVTYRDDEEYVRALVLDAAVKFLPKCDRAAVFSGIRLLHDYPKPTSIGCVYVPNGAGRDKWGFGCFQPILYYGKCPFLAAGKGSRPNSFSDNQPGESGIDHPCPKPVKWMDWLVARTSFFGHTVLDPFMGSGTTGVACMNLGRKFIGIEIEPKYFDIACRRIEDAQRQQRMFT